MDEAVIFFWLVLVAGMLWYVFAPMIFWLIGKLFTTTVFIVWFGIRLAYKAVRSVPAWKHVA